MLGFIPEDGYVRSAYFKAMENLYDEIRFTYRPIVSEERKEFVAKLTKNVGDNNRRAESLIVSRLISWNLCHPVTNEPLPIEGKIVRRLQPALQERILDVVLGTDGGDLDPLVSDKEQEEFLRDQAEAKQKNVPIADVRDNRDAKN